MDKVGRGVPRPHTGRLVSNSCGSGTTITRNSSGDEIVNVNFLYDDIVHALKIQFSACTMSS